MDAAERIKMVKAMEFIARQLNNENHIYGWMTYGVADGDIEYGDLEVKPEDHDNLEYYIDDDVRFADLMDSFLYYMSRAYTNGGLYCDHVVSKSAN